MSGLFDQLYNQQQTQEFANPQTPNKIRGIQPQTQSTGNGLFDQLYQQQKGQTVNQPPITQTISPNTPVSEGSPLTFAQRLRLSFGNTEGQKNYLRSIGLNPLEDSEGRMLVQKGDKIYQVDEAGFSASDIADLTGKALPFLGSLGGIVAGGLAGAPVGGVGAIPSAVAGGAIGGAAGETARQTIGKFLGVNASGGGIAEIGKEAAFGGIAGATAGIGGAVAPTLARAIPFGRPVASGILKSATGEAIGTKLAPLGARLAGEAVEAGTQGAIIGGGQRLAETGDIGEAAKGAAAGFGFGAPFGPIGYGAFKGIGAAGGAVVRKAEETVATQVGGSKSRIARAFMNNVVLPVRKVMDSFGPSAKQLREISQDKQTKQINLLGESSVAFSKLDATLKGASEFDINTAAQVLTENKRQGVNGLNTVDELLAQNPTMSESAKQIVRDNWESYRPTSEELSNRGVRIMSRERTLAEQVVEAGEIAERPLSKEPVSKLAEPFVDTYRNKTGLKKFAAAVKKTEGGKILTDLEITSIHKELTEKIALKRTVTHPSEVKTAVRANPILGSFDRKNLDKDNPLLERAKQIVEKDPRVSSITDPDEKLGRALTLAEKEFEDKGITYSIATIENPEVGWDNLQYLKGELDTDLPLNAGEFGDVVRRDMIKNANIAAVVGSYLDAGIKLTPDDFDVLEKLGPQKLAKQLNERLIEKMKGELTTAGRVDVVQEAEKFIRKQQELIFEMPNTVDDLFDIIKKIQATKLSMSFIPNAFQSLNTLLATDFPAMAAAFRGIFDEVERTRARQAGAGISGLLQRETQITTGPLAEKSKGVLSKAIAVLLKPFVWTENFNRTFAGIAGIKFVDRIAKLGEYERLRGLLKDSVLDDLIKTGRKELTEQELLYAASRFINKTQFGANILDLPSLFNSGFGSVIFQFKSFAYRQMNFIINETAGEWRAGRQGRATKNLVILLSMYPAGGAAINGLKAFIKGEDISEYDRSAVTEYFDNISSVGAFGVVGNVIEAADDKRFYEMLAGPTGKSVVDLIQLIPETIRGIFTDEDIPLESIERTVTQQFGGAGTAFRKRFLED